MQDETLPPPPPMPSFGGAPTEPVAPDVPEVIDPPVVETPLDPAPSPDAPNAESTESVETSSEPYDPELKRGDQSGYVRKFQRWLRNAYGCDVTGIFDRQTETKVLQFQREHQLEQNGKASKETWAKLRELNQA